MYDISYIRATIRPNTGYEAAVKKDGKPKAPGAGRALDWGAGRVAFLANAASIRQQLEAGHPMTKVYAEFQGRLSGLTYEGFRYHVNRQRVDMRRPIPAQQAPTEPPQLHQAAPLPTVSAHPLAAQPPRESGTTQTPRSRDTTTTRPRSFDFDPTPRDFS